jgi:hypothetical protein
MKKVIEAVGEYTWNIPCKDAEHAGFEITVNSGKPNTDCENAYELWDTDGFSGLKDGFIRFKGYDKQTGWESEWECSLESFIKLFAIRVADGVTKINGEEVKSV